MIIDAKECFPDMDYQGGGLDLPGSIVPPLGSPGKESKVSNLLLLSGCGY